MAEDIKKYVMVDAAALTVLLTAVTGGEHQIRELQATRKLAELTGESNPIDLLVDQLCSQLAIPMVSPFGPANRFTPQQNREYLESPQFHVDRAGMACWRLQECGKSFFRVKDKYWDTKKQAWVKK